VFGLKPSFGLVPQRGYLDHVGGGTTDADINVFGPLARSADDLEMLFGVLAGPEPERALAWRAEPPAPRHRDLASYRVGVWFEEPACPLDRDMLAVLRGTVDQLAAAGVKVEEAHPPVDFMAQVGLFNRLIMPAISPSAPADVQEAMGGSHYQWLVADQERAALKATWAEWFETYDILLCPVLSVPAPPHNQEGDIMSRTITVNGTETPYISAVMWTGLIGVVGLPSAVAPLARTPQGLPVGVQVVAPFLRDRDAIFIAGQIAQVAGGYEVPPGLAT
jgi:amidase